MIIANSLKSRLPRGVYYEAKKRGKKYLNTSYEFLYYDIYRKAYFTGHFDDCILNAFKKFYKEGRYDFGVICVPDIFFNDVVASEVNDLILPYITNIESPIGEGTYEEFGVAVNAGDIVIDAGANCGVFSAFAAKHRGAFVYAFEPVSSVINNLKQTLLLNDCIDKVEVVAMGLSDKKDIMEIAISETNIGGSTLLFDKEQLNLKKETINVTTIDDFVKDNNLKKVDFIKADIEGAERSMLLGATETLKRFKPQLSICTYHLPDDKEVLTNIIMSANPDYKIEYGEMKLYAK